MNIQDMAAAIRDKVHNGLEGLVHRDRPLLTGVAKELGLEPTDMNLAQVRTLLTEQNVNTGQEYPKRVYPDGPGTKGVIVNNEVEEQGVIAEDPPVIDPPVPEPDDGA